MTENGYSRVEHVNQDDLERAISKDVQFACRARRIMQPQRIAVFSRCISAVVLPQLPDAITADHPDFKQLLKQQITLLKQSLDTLQQRMADEQALLQSAMEQPRHQDNPEETIPAAGDSSGLTAARSFEEKLADERQLLKELVNKDCLQLGLLTPERVKQICEHLAGKTPQQAEQAIITEVRNNLHRQIREYIRKNKGGPWGSAKQQNELRLEIQSTGTLRSVLSLTRHLLRERKQWEKNNSGGLRNLLKKSLKL